MRAFPATPPPNGLARLDWSVPAGTRGVIVELGANDMLRGVDPKVTRKALEEIVRRLREREIAGAARRHEGGAQSRRRLRPAFEAIYRSSPPSTTCCSIRSFSTGLRPTRRSTSATACIRPRPASTHRGAHPAQGRGTDGAHPPRSAAMHRASDPSCVEAPITVINSVAAGLRISTVECIGIAVDRARHATPLHRPRNSH